MSGVWFRHLDNGLEDQLLTTRGPWSVAERPPLAAILAHKKQHLAKVETHFV